MIFHGLGSAAAPVQLEAAQQAQSGSLAVLAENRTLARSGSRLLTGSRTEERGSDSRSRVNRFWQ
jgi:hypothetical protein